MLKCKANKLIFTGFKLPVVQVITNEIKNKSFLLVRLSASQNEPKCPKSSHSNLNMGNPRSEVHSCGLVTMTCRTLHTIAGR